MFTASRKLAGLAHYRWTYYVVHVDTLAGVAIWTMQGSVQFEAKIPLILEDAVFSPERLRLNFQETLKYGTEHTSC